MNETEGAKAKDRILPVLFIFYFVLIATLWWLHLSSSLPEIKITGFDSITTSGSTTTLAAKLEVDRLGPFNPDLEAIRVHFSSGLMPDPVEVEADDEGIAQLSFTPSDEGLFRFHVRPVDRSSYRLRELDLHGAAPGLWVWPADAPIVICDLDDTVTDGGSWKTLVRGPGPDPLPGAAEVLGRLVKERKLVFVTARDDGILNSTRYWLLEHRFPLAPVIGRDWSFANVIDPGPDKLAIFRHLAKSFTNIQLGIGNSEGDCYAYRSQGIPHITLDESHCQGIDGAPRCSVARDWQQVAEILAKE